MKKSLLVLTVTGAVLAGCSSYDSGNALEHWKNYGSDSLSTAQLSDKQALAVFYRTADFQGPALNVYINGDYQASLTEQGYTPVAVCASNQLISASYTTNQKFGNRTQGSSHALPVKEVAFFRASTDGAGNPTFERVDVETAKAEMANLNGKVTHTLPRVVTDKECSNIVLSNTVLSAGALWGLNKHSYKDMLSQGKKEIAEFAEYVKGNDQVGRIEVRGYTDPEASDAYNLSLSQKRADTVKAALEQAGVTQTISATGYGETNLIVSNCAALHKNKTARAACNQPNRRVEITTYSK
jgi:OOP family OmpA-OmpF porin